jgi:2'-5' RNA ligase
MRTFIAIELTEEMREVLARAESHLKYAGADVKWVDKANIHLTIKFLGEITDTKADEVKALLDRIACETKPFDLSLKDIGAFPKIEYPKVLWMGIGNGESESIALAGNIDSALFNIGFPKETRPFAAHLTIGRVRSPKNRAALKEKISSYRLPGIFSQRASAVVFFKSTLTPRGPIYAKLHESVFSGE